MAITKKQLSVQLKGVIAAKQACYLLSIGYEKIQQPLSPLFQRHDELFNHFQEIFTLFEAKFDDPALQKRISDFLNSSYNDILYLIRGIQTQQARDIAALSSHEQQRLTLVCEQLQAAWSLDKTSPMHEQRQRKWAFDGITCDYIVSQDQDSYYEITATILKLKNRQLLIPIQEQLEILDEACSIKNRTVRNKAGHISVLYLDKGDEKELNALYEGITQIETLATCSSLVDIHETYIPGLTEEAKPLVKQIQEHPKTIYQIWGRIPKKHLHFTGRQDLLRALLQTFITRKQSSKSILTTSNVLYQSILGPGGVGKTQLAARYVHLCCAQQDVLQQQKSAHSFISLFEVGDKETPIMSRPPVYHGIIWLDASHGTSLLAGFQEVAASIGLTFEKESIGSLPIVRQAVYQRLANLPRLLFIFDGIVDPVSIEEHLPQSSDSLWRHPCDCLLTTRHRHSRDMYHPITLDVFSDNESLAYLKNTLQIEHLAEQENTLKTLSDTLGHLPLALAQAVSYINTQSLEIATYLAYYTHCHDRILLLDHPSHDSYSRTVLATWLLSVTALSQTQQGCQAISLLFAISLLEGSCIEKLLLETYLNVSRIQLNALLTLLMRYSLIETLPESLAINLHALVQKVIQDYLTGKLKTYPCTFEHILTAENIPTTWIEVALNLGKGLIDYAAPQTSIISDLARRKMLLPHLETFISCLNDPALNFIPRLFLPPSSAAMKNTLKIQLYNLQGDIAHEHGYFQTAKNSFEISLSLQQAYGRQNQVAIARTLGCLGNTLESLGDYHRQKLLLEEALSIEEAHYGRNHPRTATTLANVANALGNLGDHQGKKRLLKEALKIFKKHYGPHHILVGNTLGDLANALGHLGEYRQKKRLLKKALPIQQAYYGNDHVKVASTTLLNLANVQGDLGEYQEQRRLLEQVLTIQQAYYGETHTSVAKTLNNLAIVLGKLGNLEGKKQLLDKALVILTAHYGENHTEVALALLNVASALEGLGKFGEQKRLLEKALSIQKAHYGYDHIVIARTLEHLGTLLSHLGNLHQGKQLLEQALAIQRSYYGEDQIEVARTLNNLSMTLGHLEEYQEQKQALEQVLAIQKAYYGCDHVAMARTLRNLGNTLGNLGNYPEQQRLLAQALTLQETCCGQEHPIVIGTLIDLADALRKKPNCFPEQRSLLEKALAIQETHYGGNHIVLVGTLFKLGMLKKDLGQPQEAMQDLSKALLLIKSTPGYEHHPGLFVIHTELNQLSRQYNSRIQALPAYAFFQPARSSLNVDNKSIPPFSSNH